MQALALKLKTLQLDNIKLKDAPVEKKKNRALRMLKTITKMTMAANKKQRKVSNTSKLVGYCHVNVLDCSVGSLKKEFYSMTKNANVLGDGLGLVNNDCLATEISYQ